LLRRVTTEKKKKKGRQKIEGEGGVIQACAGTDNIHIPLVTLQSHNHAITQSL